MRYVKLGMVPYDTLIGDPYGTGDKLVELAEKLASDGVTVAVFPELVISGYSLDDLVQWKFVVDQQAEVLISLAERTKHLDMVLVVGVTIGDRGDLYNCAAVLQGGKILGLVSKQNLPGYSLFREPRTHSRGLRYFMKKFKLLGYAEKIPLGDMIFEFPFGTMAVEVCEDGWSNDPPIRHRTYEGAELVVNISASPWRKGVIDTKREMLPTRSADHSCALVYVNRFGGQDSASYDGTCFVYVNGIPIFESIHFPDPAEVEYFTQSVDLDSLITSRRVNRTWGDNHADYLEQGKSLLVVESEVAAPQSKILDISLNPYNLMSREGYRLDPKREYFDDLFRSIEVALGGYFEKTGAFERIGIALSGGMDSALCLLIAVRYGTKLAKKRGLDPKVFLKDFIHCFSMPTKYNSKKTRSIARNLAKALGVSFMEMPISEIHNLVLAYEREMLGDHPMDPLQVENNQPRIRSMLMMDWSNSMKAIIIVPGNKTEIFTGYMTYGGDMLGGFAPLGDIWKTDEIEYFTHFFSWPDNPQVMVQVARILATPPSAELSKGQTDEKALGPFPVITAVGELFMKLKLSPYEVYQQVRQMFSDDDLRKLWKGYAPGMLKIWVKRNIQRFFMNEWKRAQGAPVAKTSDTELDFKRSFMLPLAMSFKFLDPEFAKIDQMPD